MKTFYLGYPETGNFDKLVSYDSAQAADLETHEWVKIEANSLEEAEAGYDAAFDALMGKTEIPARYSLIKTGVTRPRDQVAKEAELRFFTPVTIGGIPVMRYYAVIRPMKGARPWSKTRKFDKPAKQRKRKTAKKAKTAVKAKRK